MKKNRFGKRAYTLVILLCLLAIGYSTMTLFHDFQNRADNQSLVEEVQSQKQESQMLVILQDMASAFAKVPKVEPILAEYQQLYAQNNDMYGWIKIEGTIIDYPVMFTPEDPNFYEKRNWNKEICRGLGTSIWIDGRVTQNSKNILVYGHNTTIDKSMFGSLKDYKEPSYYEMHKYIQFDTLYEKATYEIISVSKGVVYYSNEPEGEYLFYHHLELDSKEEFEAYVDNAKQNAYYTIEATAQYGDQLITLCTCDKWTKDGRLYIVAKKIEI